MLDGQILWASVSTSLPSRAQVVVVGGGVIGCSVAYHLGAMGCTDVLLLERDQLTSGTTWHAAGLMVTFGSMSETSTKLRQYSRDLYARLEAETGQATGFKPVGFIELATEADRLIEYRRIAAFNRLHGVEVEEISANEVATMFPLARTDDVLAGFYVASDGRVNPVDVTQALAKGARKFGVTIRQGVVVDQVLQRNGRVIGVRTPLGDVEADVVVNCTGMWARQLGESAGVNISLQAAEHYYLITEQIAGLDASWPVIEDPASHGYYREEVGGLMIGLFEPECAPWNVGRIPQDFSFGSIPPDWDRMAPYLQRAMSRVPISLDTGVRTFFCGPESFTPDLAPVFGEAPELANFFVAAGLNSIGILSGGGIGRAMAHWVLNGEADIDITGINIDRLHRYQSTPRYRRARTVESLGMVYQCHYPHRVMSSARGAKLSPLHDRLARQGAFFTEVSGWESPAWFDPSGAAPTAQELTWERPTWFRHWRAEHDAVRNAVGLIDMSFMAKFKVAGRDAARLLNHLSTSNVDGDVGTIVYTQWLNGSGHIEADVTVSKLAEGDFLVVATDTAARHVEAWLRRHVGDLHVFVHDVSGALAQINVQGPQSRRLLEAVTDGDPLLSKLAYRGMCELSIGLARATCARITYVGELGYELYVPVEQACHVYDALVEHGATFGLRHVGLRALASLRMEKGYRDYGHDIDNTDDLLTVGLSFTADLAKPDGFLGRDALLQAMADRDRRGGLHQRLVQIRCLDAEPLLFHGEVVYADGRAVGSLRSASYGHTLGGGVGLAMVALDSPITAESVAATSWELDVAGRRFPAVAALRPMYDPNNLRIVSS